MTRTLNHAHAAAETDRFINDRTVIRHFDGTCRTCLLTDTAADTAGRTDLSGFFAILLVRTANYNIIGTFMDMNHLLRTFPHAFAAGDAFCLIYFCHTILINSNCLERTG